jgi:hypothetical protein
LISESPGLRGLSVQHFLISFGEIGFDFNVSEAPF